MTSHRKNLGHSEPWPRWMDRRIEDADEPKPLRGYTRYRLDDHYEPLRAHLAGQQVVVKPKPGLLLGDGGFGRV